VDLKEGRNVPHYAKEGTRSCYLARQEKKWLQRAEKGEFHAPLLSTGKKRQSRFSEKKRGPKLKGEEKKVLSFHRGLPATGKKVSGNQAVIAVAGGKRGEIRLKKSGEEKKKKNQSRDGSLLGTFTVEGKKKSG